MLLKEKLIREREEAVISKQQHELLSKQKDVSREIVSKLQSFLDAERASQKIQSTQNSQLFSNSATNNQQSTLNVLNDSTESDALRKLARENADNSLSLAQAD